MPRATTKASGQGLEGVGLEGLATVHWNLGAPALYEEAVKRAEAVIADGGALVATTGAHTGRSPNDKFLVREKSSDSQIWWGRVNRAIEPAQFDLVLQKMRDYYRGREAFVQDVHAGADARHRLPVRVVTEQAWQSLFARNMFLRLGPREAQGFEPEFTVLQAPGLKAEPEKHGTNSEVFILLSFERKLVLIGGTKYAGEIKKSVFSVLNYLLPAQGVLPMHCSANVRGRRGRVALLRPLRDGQDDALRRPAAPPHRRRRARLERPRRLQLRGRLLREGDPALARGGAADPRGDPPLRHDPRERRHRPRDPRGWTSTTASSRRTRARPTRSASSTARSRPARRGTRTTSSSSRATRSACCRRSRSSRPRRRCTTSSRATPRRSRAPSAA